MTVVDISAGIVSICGAVIAIWRVVKIGNRSIKSLVAKEMQTIAKMQQELIEENKTLLARIEALTQSSNETKAQVKGLSFALGEFQGGIKSAMNENTEVLKDLKKSKAEWITQELLKIKGSK